MILNWLVVALVLQQSLHAATNAETDEILKLSPPHGELPPSFGEQYGWWVGLAAVFLLGLAGAALWWLLRPKPTMPVPIEIRSRKELEALRQRSEDGQVLSQVSRVLRHYVAGAFDLPLEELTTSEFCRVIGAHEKIGPDLAVRVGEFLRQCDEIKFAPGAPPMPIGAAVRALELVELGEARRAWLRQKQTETAVSPTQPVASA